MENPLAIAVTESGSPAKLYGLAFSHFHKLFALCPKGDVSRIQLPSHLPAEAYRDRTRLGWVLTGALVAIVAHRLEGHMAELMMIVAAESSEEIGMCVASWPPELVARLDDVIRVQGAITGAGLQASDLVMMRVLEWERHDYDKKYKPWLRALDKAARVYCQTTAAPPADPFLRIVKKKAVEELGPMLARMKKKFEEYRGAGPGTKNPDAVMRQKIVEAFKKEAQNPDLPFLSNPHNRERWLRFCEWKPLCFLALSPEKLFDACYAFTTLHDDPEYVRKSISSLK